MFESEVGQRLRGNGNFWRQARDERRVVSLSEFGGIGYSTVPYRRDHDTISVPFTSSFEGEQRLLLGEAEVSGP